MLIMCPKCGHHGRIEEESPAANNNETHMFTPPEGFLKIAHGWAAKGVHLYCRQCAVEAIRARPVDLPG